MKSYSHVIEPPFEDIFNRDHELKGKWHSSWFGNDNPIVLELGCGKGEYTVGLSEHFPEKNFVGIDIKGARIWKGAKESFQKGIPNVSFLRTRIEFITSFFAPGEVDEIWITFPDPQLKRKREKKRLPGPYFLNLYRKILRNGGLIHLKTDNKELYEYALGVVMNNKLEIVTSTPDLYKDLPGDPMLSIQTHYEKIFLAQGIPIKYLLFRLGNDREIVSTEEY